jgi:hypothetical protein
MNPVSGASKLWQVEEIFRHDEIAYRTIQRRAVEAVNWGMPAVSYDRMYQAMINLGGNVNQIVYWSRLSDWRNQTLTPNPDAIYFMPFFNTKKFGAMVLEIPPVDGGSITGSIMDSWQTALEDVGPAGADRGKGGRYLILPPDYPGTMPAGYIALRSITWQGFALLRSMLKGGSDADIAAAVAYGRGIRLYPLSQAANPQTTFVDASGTLFDANIPYDLRFFQSLDRMVQIEPWLMRDRVMIDLLKSIGIEKGKRFTPDVRTQALLVEAAGEAQTWLADRYETAFPVYYEDRQWILPGMQEFIDAQATSFETPEAYAIDARGIEYHAAFGSAKRLDAGQFYLHTLRDSRGRALNGNNQYRLTFPSNIPARHAWSVVAYDRATHGLIRNLPHSNRSSQSRGLQKNANGGVDLYFGSRPLLGRESNWIPTQAGTPFEVTLRFTSPEKPLFDKSWKMNDIEQLK